MIVGICNFFFLNKSNQQAIRKKLIAWNEFHSCYSIRPHISSFLLALVLDWYTERVANVTQLLCSYETSNNVTYLCFPPVLSPKVLGIAIARYDFCARDMRELSLLKGDVVKIYTKISANGWWRGEVNGRVSLSLSSS